MEPNPYESPISTSEAPSFESLEESLAIRRSHIKDELWIRAFGWVFHFAGGAIVVFFGYLATHVRPGVWCILLPLPAILCFLVGERLRTLDNRVLIPAILLTIGAILVWPICLPVGAVILYMLLRRKGRFIMSRRYQQLVVETAPRIWFKTPLPIAILLVVPLCFLFLYYR